MPTTMVIGLLRDIHSSRCDSRLAQVVNEVLSEPVHACFYSKHGTLIDPPTSPQVSGLAIVAAPRTADGTSVKTGVNVCCLFVVRKLVSVGAFSEHTSSGCVDYYLAAGDDVGSKYLRLLDYHYVSVVTGTASFRLHIAIHTTTISLEIIRLALSKVDLLITQYCESRLFIFKRDSVGEKFLMNANNSAGPPAWINNYGTMPDAFCTCTTGQ